MISHMNSIYQFIIFGESFKSAGERKISID
jgi:hypothetical protein